MLHQFLSLPASVAAFLGEHLTLLTVSAALLAAAALLGRVVVLLAADRYPEPRHRPLALPAAPISAPPAPQLALAATPFDPLDVNTPLDEVEQFIRSLGHPTSGDLDEAWAEAHREDWARTRVAEEGKSWDTHLAKFSGAVLPRDDSDTRELEAVK